MSTLVFQAILGGAINVVGTNTASTFTITVPAFTGTLASLAAVTNNGVAYINSSGQPTTGSALIFDGTNLGIGITPGTKLDAYTSGTASTLIRTRNDNVSVYLDANSTYTYLNTFSNHPMLFGTNNIERMRLDASGNLLVGTLSAAGERFTVYNTSTSQVTAIVKNNATSGITTDIFQVQTAQAAGTGYYLSRFYSGAVTQFGVRGDGLIFSASLNGGATTLSTDAFGNIIRTPSDSFLKTNVQSIQYGLDTVMKLKPIKHDWVEHIKMGTSSIGFIAQEMELEIPEIVNGAEYKSIDYPKLTAVLTKAIQELKAEFDTYKSTRP
jgi:hypothetical protein